MQSNVATSGFCAEPNTNLETPLGRSAPEISQQQQTRGCHLDSDSDHVQAATHLDPEMVLQLTWLESNVATSGFCTELTTSFEPLPVRCAESESQLDIDALLDSTLNQRVPSEDLNQNETSPARDETSAVALPAPLKTSQQLDSEEAHFDASQGGGGLHCQGVMAARDTEALEQQGWFHEEGSQMGDDTVCTDATVSVASKHGVGRRCPSSLAAGLVLLACTVLAILLGVLLPNNSELTRSAELTAPESEHPAISPSTLPLATGAPSMTPAQMNRAKPLEVVLSEATPPEALLHLNTAQCQACRWMAEEDQLEHDFADPDSLRKHHVAALLHFSWTWVDDWGTELLKFLSNTPICDWNRDSGTVAGISCLDIDN